MVIGVGAQEGAHQHQSLEAQIRALTERVEALESRPTGSPSGAPTDPGAQQVDPPAPGAENEALDPNLLYGAVDVIGREANRYSNKPGLTGLKFKDAMGVCSVPRGPPLQNLEQARCLCKTLKQTWRLNPISRLKACRDVMNSN